MIQLPHIRVRVRRLRELAEGLFREVNRWKDQEGQLLSQERRSYLDGLQDVVKGLDDARHALAVPAGRRAAMPWATFSKPVFELADSRPACGRRATTRGQGGG